MKFFTVDRGILRSSLWTGCDSDTRVVWFTLLAMADEAGFVNATAPGVAHAACVPLDKALEALGRFESADSHSRTQDNDGRRIERVNGGYALLNHALYRPGAVRKKTQAPTPKADKEELEYRVSETWGTHVRTWRRFYERANGFASGPDPKLTPEIRTLIVESLQTYDSDYLAADQREAWREFSKTRAAGMGIFLDPFLTAQTPENDRSKGGKMYLEHWRPWKTQRGKACPVEKFAELYFEDRDARRHARA